MTLVMGQWPVTGTAATATINIPPGVYNITLYNVNTAATFYLGIGTSPTVAPNLSTVNGLQLHTIPTSWNGYQGESGGYLWAISTGVGTVAFNYILSTQQR